MLSKKLDLAYGPLCSNASVQRRDQHQLVDICAQTPEEMAYACHVYHIYAIRTLQRDALRQSLHIQGIHTGIHHLIPVHLQEVHADLGYRYGDFPCSEQVAGEVLSLPMYAELTEEQVERIASAVSGG